MVMPMWLSALGAAGAGVANAFEKQRARDQQLRMAQILANRQNGGLGQMPASTGAGLMGPQQSWGANNSVQGGVVHDQWGNPIGPAGAPYGDPSAGASSGAAPIPYDPTMGSNPTLPSGASPMPTQMPGMTPQAPVPYTSGTLASQGQLSGPMDMTGGVDPMSALFSAGGFGL